MMKTNVATNLLELLESEKVGAFEKVENESEISQNIPPRFSENLVDRN